MIAKVLIENPSEEQFREVRRSLITGTDIGSILGMNPFGTRYGTALEKKGKIAAKEENEAMWLGKQSEPHILMAFSRKMGRRVRPNRSVFVHPEREWMGATPDAFVDEPEEGVEAKLVGLGAVRQWGESGSPEVPPSHYLQCMWYMAVTGLDRWWLVPQIGTRLQQHPIERDEKVITSLIGAAEEFRNRYVLTDELPEPGADDVERVTALYPVSTEGVVEETPEIRSLVRVLAAARLEQEIAERVVRDARAKLEAVLGEKEKLKGSDFTISWRSAKPKQVVDYEEVVVSAISKLPAKYSTEVQKLVFAHTTTRPGVRIFRTSGALFEKGGE